MLEPASARGTGCAEALPSNRLPASLVAHLTQLRPGSVPPSGYVYDPAVAASRAAALRAVLPAWASLLFAVKANSFGPVLATLARSGALDGFEVASATEAALARRALDLTGGGRLVAAGPAKHPGLLTALLDAPVDVVHVESALELRRLSAVAVARGERVAVALRVNPARTQLHGALAMGGRPSPFGIPEPEVPAALELAGSLPGLDVVGFHVHAVCGNRDAAAHARYVAWCLDFATSTAAAHGVDLRWLDAGGGLGVDYDDAGGLDLEVFGETLAALRPPAGVEVALEPGRWIAADCGWYVAEVVDCKTSYGRAYAVVRGGINGFALPPTEDFPFPVAVLPVDSWPEDVARPELRGEITVAGELCTPEDVLVRDVQVQRVRAGDLLVFPRAGAYGWEFSLQQFLGHPVATRELLGSVPFVLDPLPDLVPDPLPAF